jgi:hypothetical protein
MISTQNLTAPASRKNLLPAASRYKKDAVVHHRHSDSGDDASTLVRSMSCSAPLWVAILCTHIALGTNDAVLPLCCGLTWIACILMKGLTAEQVEGRGGMWAGVWYRGTPCGHYSLILNCAAGGWCGLSLRIPRRFPSLQRRCSRPVSLYPLGS